MKASLYAKRFFRCPDCNGREFEVEHLLGSSQERESGPWHCEHCGVGWKLRVGADDSVDLERAENRTAPRTVVLELVFARDNRDEVLRVELETSALVAEYDGTPIGEDEQRESAAYLYEEKLCTRDILRMVSKVTIDDDEDPHGLFRLVSIEPRVAKP